MKWLFLVHQVQTPNSRERVKVWRLTKKLGTLLYRNSVYVLPYSKERLEDFQWLCTQIRDSKGEASVFVSEAKERKEDRVLKQLFVSARGKDYEELRERVKLVSDRSRSSLGGNPITAAQLKSTERDLVELEKAFSEIRRIDFFQSLNAPRLEKELTALRHSLAGAESQHETSPPIQRHSRLGLQARTWTTRKHIHIDRLSSAWLIKRFIDKKAKFVFAPENRLPENAIPFDVFGVEFSHQGDCCTFETLLEAFQIRDKALTSLAELVHNIDLKDQKYNRPESDGLDMIVRALSDSSGDDHKTLVLGSQILDALYQRLSSI